LNVIIFVDIIINFNLNGLLFSVGDQFLSPHFELICDVSLKILDIHLFKVSLEFSSQLIQTNFFEFQMISQQKILGPTIGKGKTFSTTKGF
jgi:hypothetical protein